MSFRGIAFYAGLAIEEVRGSIIICARRCGLFVLPPACLLELCAAKR